eukprot:11186623-Lingulodinium_polyedra.AAC.1
MITFDGGARAVQGCKAVAGAAIAWVRRMGHWERVALRVALIPGGDNSVVAEAWAARVTLQPTARPDLPPGP